MKKSIENQEEQTLALGKEFQEFNSRIKDWQEDFLDKFTKGQDKLLKEIAEIRDRNIKLEHQIFHNSQEIRRINSTNSTLEKRGESQASMLESLLKKTESLDTLKMDKEAHSETEKRLNGELEKLKYDVENHGNHFAMVENFVEKYIPIRIQSTISEVMSWVLPYKERKKLAEFEKRRFMELHQIILEDDGIPHLADQLKQIRMRMDDK